MDNEILYRHNFKSWLGVLPGCGWLEDNEHKYDGWKPHCELAGPGFKHTITLNPGAKGVIKGVMKGGN